MICFIDLGNQIDPMLEGTKHFAWFDTVTDSFEEYDGEQTWESWEDFKEAYQNDERSPLRLQIVQLGIEDSHTLERYWGLFPKEWPQEEEMSEKSIHTEGAVPLHAIKVLEDELKSLKRQRDTFIFQKSYSMRYSGQEIGKLETAIKILEKSKEK